jgi:hypothetical protein
LRAAPIASRESWLRDAREAFALDDVASVRECALSIAKFFALEVVA